MTDSTSRAPESVAWPKVDVLASAWTTAGNAKPFMLDVRPTEEYQAAHVAGAVSIPLQELEESLRELPRDREIVAYCRGPYCAFAPEAVRTLRAHGYVARHLADGLPEWVAAGNGVESDGAGVPTADR